MKALAVFLSSGKRNEWLHGRDIKIYVRRSQRLIDGQLRSCFDLANIQAKKPGNGSWTRLIENVQKNPTIRKEFDFIFIENVLTERFAGWFRRNDWHEQMNLMPSFYLSTKGR